MSPLSSQPTGLPIAGLPIAGQPRERSDAAANRERILCAARRLLAEQGAAGLSMNAVAAAAGVGKGTIFRRFGDRDGLTTALLDAHTADLQNAFLSGPPPLGPGAPPRERLEAFVRALVAFQDTHLEILLAAERRVSVAPPVHATFLTHVRTLLEQIDPRIDAPVVAGLLLSAVSPIALHRLLRAQGIDAARVADAAVALMHGVTCA
jgi:AcrR family transcriptional regulator